MWPAQFWVLKTKWNGTFKDVRQRWYLLVHSTHSIFSEFLSLVCAFPDISTNVQKKLKSFAVWFRWKAQSSSEIRIRGKGNGFSGILSPSCLYKELTRLFVAYQTCPGSFNRDQAVSRWERKYRLLFLGPSKVCRLSAGTQPGYLSPWNGWIPASWHTSQAPPK